MDCRPPFVIIIDYHDCEYDGECTAVVIITDDSKKRYDNGVNDDDDSEEDGCTILILNRITWCLSFVIITDDDNGKTMMTMIKIPKESSPGASLL